jgi:hypothetical protein
MKTKYLAGLLGSCAIFGVLSVVALLLFLRGEQLRQVFGKGDPAWQRYEARVESGNFSPETLRSFTNQWFLAQKQDHQVILAEETVNESVARSSVFIGVFGLLTVLFQTWVIFRLRKDLRKP